MKKNLVQRFEITVKPGAKRDGFERGTDDRITARLRAPAREGQANEALQEMIAKRLGCPKSAVRVLTPRSRRKIIEAPAEADVTRLVETDREKIR